jgi:hypothetical protein
VKSVDGLERVTGWRPMGLKFKSCWNTVSVGVRKSVTKWTVVIVDVEEHVDEEVVRRCEIATTFTAYAFSLSSTACCRVRQRRHLRRAPPRKRDPLRFIHYLSPDVDLRCC